MIRGIVLRRGGKGGGISKAVIVTVMMAILSLMRSTSKCLFLRRGTVAAFPIIIHNVSRRTRSQGNLLSNSNRSHQVSRTSRRWLVSTTSPSSSPEREQQQEEERILLIRQELERIGIDAEQLHQAAISSIENPTAGYDSNFGKPAIKTYRSFIYPKKEMVSTSIAAAAGRCARQLDFQIKRQKSQTAEWVRNHDPALKARKQVFPLVLVLDNLRSSFNVGSIFRTADACGCQEIITCGITPHPDGSGSDKLAKSALGAERLVPSRHFATTREALDYLRMELKDFEIIGMETTDQSQVYTDVEYSRKVALVLGNEVTGVDTELMESLDTIVEIPMFGAKNSLNVAACAPVVLYEILRQWKV